MSSLVANISRVFASSIGKKIIVALTGLAMVGFLVGHLLGNLLIFSGPKALNDYGQLLHENAKLIWFARVGLLVAVGLHIFYTIKLVQENRAARPTKYGFENTRRASKSSRVMILSGLTILAFVVYHLMHYTWGVNNGYYDKSNARYFLDNGQHNIYNMMVDGFRFAPATLFYLVSIGLLCSHLSHGIASCFQTLGLTTPRTRSAIHTLGWVVAIGLFLGFASIPLAVVLGFVS
jgi:succinate dehydrogenase / fumarate reductase, cytochrome b subunit